MNPPESVRIVDVSPRDGLQNEQRPVSTATKIGLVERLQDAGLRWIEAASFVSPRWVPQMADGPAVMRGVRRAPGVRFAALVPNLRGLETALDAPREAWPDDIVVFGSASETFSRKNINCSIAESIARFAPVAVAARAQGLRVRAAMSCTVGCPFEGDVAPEAVGRLAAMLRDIGVQEVAVADTIGVGTPDTVRRALEAALAHFPAEDVSGHFHDTHGRALANTEASLALGIRQFDTSAAGLGGCPYAPGATGNVATEAVVDLLHARGFATGIDPARLREAGRFIRDALRQDPQAA
ncbi:MAG: hydroxymethylglutaryl-CoA lyase [Xylophilus ampelinus]